jgi:hypothetical protein
MLGVYVFMHRCMYAQVYVSSGTSLCLVHVSSGTSLCLGTCILRDMLMLRYMYSQGHPCA